MTTSTKDMATMVGKNDLSDVMNALKDGGLILLPTDTVWSIACNSTDQVAIHRLKRLKGEHSPFDLELLVHSIEMFKRYTAHLHPRLETLLLYHTRPLTIVAEQARRLPELAISEEGSAAIRLVRDPYCQSIVERRGVPLLTTSANSAQHPVPSHFGSIRSDIIEGVDYVSRHRRKDLHDGRLAVMVRLTDKDELLFLRE